MAGIILSDPVSGSPLFIGKTFRQLLGALAGGKAAGRPLGGRTGVSPGTPATTASATATTWTVQPHSGVLDLQAATDAGPCPYAFGTAVTGAMTPPDATNTRIDILSIRHDDPASGDGSAVPLPVVVYTAGNPATGAVPATPARCMKIAQITVPSTTAGGAPVVSWVAPYSAAAGGIIPVSSSNPYPDSPSAGQYVDDAVLGLLRWDGTGWRSVSPPRAQFRYTNVTPQTLSSTTDFTTLTGFTIDKNTIGLTATAGVFTVPAGGAGSYKLSGQVGAISGATLIAAITVNDTIVLAGRSASTVTFTVCPLPEFEVDLAVGDRVSLTARALSDGITVTTQAGYAPFLRLERVA